MDTPSLTKWAIHSHSPALTYISSSPPCTLIGDAAHAMPPYAGSGAGQAIEDALILSHALSLVTSSSQITSPPQNSSADQISHALKCYDEVRRPRCERAVASSREAGELIGLREETVRGLGGVERMGRELEGRMGWVWGADIQAMVSDVEKKFRDGLIAEKGGGGEM